MYNNVVPDWFKSCSVYQVNPRTFSAEGTISAVTKELPLLAGMGFKIIYLCPIFKADDSADKTYWSTRQKASNTENPKNPYRMNDYFEIDEEYGSMAELKEFTAGCHRLGLKAMLDLVYLHISPNADILKAHPEFAVRNEDGSIVLNQWNFARLDFTCEGLREYLWCNMTYYIGVIGADGFRCDVGDDVPLDFWEEGKRRIRAIKPDAVMINEGQKPEYLDVFDTNYGFYWHDCLYDLLCGEKTAAEVIKEYGRYAGAGLILRDMDNHDTVTDWPFRIEEHFGHDAMECVLAVNYTLDGVPMVYCGNELADTARLSMFANRFYPGSFGFTDRKRTGAAVDRRKEAVKTLNLMKSRLKALSDGKTVWLDCSGGAVLAFRRIYGEEKLTFIGNFSDEPVELNSIPGGDILLSNNSDFKDGSLRLSSFGYIIIKE